MTQERKPRPELEVNLGGEVEEFRADEPYVEEEGLARFPDNWDEEAKESRSLAGKQNGAAGGEALAMLGMGDFVSFEENGEPAEPGGDVVPPTKESVENATRSASAQPGLSVREGELLTQLRKDLNTTLPISGFKLDSVRDTLRELSQNPALKESLQPLMEAFKLPTIIGRTDAVAAQLESTDPDVRSAARNSELARISQMNGRGPNENIELARLRRTLQTEFAADLATNTRMLALSDKQEEGTATADELKALDELTKSSGRIGKRIGESERALLAAMEMEFKRDVTADYSGGAKFQRKVFDAFNQRLEERGLANKYKLIPFRSGAMDDAGADFILFDKKTGNFMFVDPTLEPEDSPRKMKLPKLRRDGVVYESKPLDAQFDAIIGKLKAGSPLNIADIFIPTSSQNSSFVKTDDFKTLDRIRGLTDIGARQLEMKAFRAELQERREGLRMMMESAERKAPSLRAISRENPDYYALNQWREFTGKSPLRHVEERLADLEILERGLPENLRPLRATKLAGAVEVPDAAIVKKAFDGVEAKVSTGGAASSVAESLDPRYRGLNRALESTLENVAKAIAESKGKDGVVKLDTPLRLKLPDRTLVVGAIESKGEHVYFKSAVDGQNYSADGWANQIKEGLEAIIKSPTVSPSEITAAKEALQVLTSSNDARASAVLEFARNYSTEFPAPAEAPSRVAASAALRKGGAPQTTPSRGPIVPAGGGTEIAQTSGGRYEVRTPTESPFAAAAVERETVPKEEIARIRERILENNDGLKPDMIARALKALDMAERGDLNVHDVLSTEMKRAGGGFDRATGRFVSASMVVLALGGWYLSNQLDSSGGSQYRPAKVN